MGKLSGKKGSDSENDDEEEQTSTSETEDAVNMSSDIPICTVLTSRIEALLKQTIAVNTVRESGYSVTELVETIQRLTQKLDGGKALKKIRTLVKILTTLHTEQHASQDQAIEWEEENQAFLHLPQTERIIIENIREDDLEKISSAVSLLLDNVILAFPTLDVFEVTEQAREKLVSPIKADKLKGIEGLVSGLLLNIIQNREFLFQDLVSEVTRFSPETVVKSLNQIYRIKEDVLNRDGHRFTDPQQLNEFTDIYTACVKFFVDDFGCFPLQPKQETEKMLLELKPTAEELRCTLNVYDVLIKGYEERGAFKPKEVNFLASEQHSLRSAANSHLANLLKFSREDEVDKEIGEQTTEEGVTGQAETEDAVKMSSDIPICTVLTSRIEALLKHTIAVNTVRESGYSVTELVETTQRLAQKLDGGKVLKKIRTLVKILTTLHTEQHASQDQAIEWEEESQKFLHLPQTGRIIIENVGEDKVETLSSAVSLCLDDVIVAFPTLDVFEVTEKARDKLVSPIKADRLKGIEGLVSGLVLNIIQNREFLFQDLVSEVTRFSPETVVESLNQIYKIKEDVINRDGHRFTDPQQLNEFTERYTACVKFFVDDFDCSPLQPKQEARQMLLELKPTAEELRCTLNVYDVLIKGYEERGAFKSKEVNYLAREQHNLWSAANSYLANVFKLFLKDETEKEVGTSADKTEEGVTGQKTKRSSHSTLEETSEKRWRKNSPTEAKQSFKSETEIEETNTSKAKDAVKISSDIPICTVLTSRLEALLKQTLAVNTVKESGYSVAELVETIKRLAQNLDGEKVLKKIRTLVKVITALHTEQHAGQDQAIEWEEKSQRFLHLPQTGRIILENIGEDKLDTLSSAASLLLDDVLVAFPTLDVFEVTEQAREKLVSFSKADRLKGIKGLISSLVLNIIQNRDFLFQDLISEVTTFSSETVVKSLNQIYKIKEEVLKRDGHRFTDPQQLNEFTDRYTACVKFFVEDFDCFLLHDKTTVIEKLLDSCLSAEELSCIVTAYDVLIHGLEGKPQDVNFLAKEQHNLWSAANSLLGELQACYPEDEAKETMEAITAYKCWFRHSGMDPVVGKISEKETDTYSKKEILRTMGQHMITDLKIEGDIPSTITEIAPKVTNLCVRSLTNPNSLEVIFMLKFLQLLDVSDSQLNDIPKSLFNLRFLHTLNLFSNNLTQLDSNRFSRLTYLEVLDVSKNKLTEFPSKLSQLVYLHTLNLSHNTMQYLDDCFSGLKRLQILDVSYNHLRVISESLSQLNFLRSLNVSHNRLKALPKSTSKLSYLQVLNASHNHIYTFPKRLNRLIFLQKLNVANNRLKSLPLQLPKKLHYLTEFEYSNNPLTSTPKQSQSTTATSNESNTQDPESSDFKESAYETGAGTDEKQTSGLGTEESDIGESFERMENISGFNPKQTTTKVEIETKEKLSAKESYTCWFRHSGMDLIVGKISEKNTDTYSKEEILGTMGKHVITDLKIEGDIPSAITKIAPKVTNLCVRSLTNPNSLEVLPQLTHLRSLDLSENDLGSLPECVSKMTSLKRLCLADCNLSRLPNSMSNMKNLETLDMSENKFSEGLPDVVTSMTSLRKLYMENCELSTLLESVSNLKNLESLNMSGNNFSEGLPDVVTSMTSLRKLSISYCKLPTLLESMSNLKNLETLDISENNFSEGLPDVVTSITSLRVLDIIFCKLPTLPERMSNLKNLETLDISENNFSEGLPDVFTSMTSLRELVISFCKLLTLPESMSNLKNLETLNMSGNSFSEGLPDVFTSMTSLRKLVISFCELPTLPESMSNLKNLKTLDMYGNSFSEGLPDVVTSMTSLRELNISFCKLPTLPESVSTLKKLETFEMSGNNFSEGLPDVFTFMTSLRELVISSCKLPTLPESLQYLENLQYLNIQDNNITTIPEAVCSLKKLHTIKQGWTHVFEMGPDLKI